MTTNPDRCHLSGSYEPTPFSPPRRKRPWCFTETQPCGVTEVSYFKEIHFMRVQVLLRGKEWVRTSREEEEVRRRFPRETWTTWYGRRVRRWGRSKYPPGSSTDVGTRTTWSQGCRCPGTIGNSKTSRSVPEPPDHPPHPLQIM